MFARVAEEFMAKEVVPRAERIYSKDWALTRELLVKAGELDLLRIDIPEAYGGLGLDKVSSAYVGEQIALMPSFGASLGALSLLHVHWTRPGLLGGLFLQSGSFFRRRFDAHESHVPRFDRIARFVSTVAGSSTGPEPIPVTLTCGTAEENLDNNRFLAAALAARGWNAPLVEHRDAHNWISWRDVLHPHLAELVLRATE